MVSVIEVVCLLTLVATVSGQYGQFSGGSMSFNFDNKTATGKWIVKVDVTTSWILGNGPCGPGCRKSDVGKDTTTSRSKALATTGDPLYFGNWTLEYKPINHTIRTQTANLNDYVTSHSTETVIAVSETAGWEQNMMTFSMPLIDNIKYEDINFDGESWRNLTMQGENSVWHMQVKIAPDVRNDTNKPNSSPQTLIRPIYRLKLNRDNKIDVIASDPDGDFVRCERSIFVQGGFIGSHPLPNMQVFPNCTVLIPTHESLGYSNDSWGAVSVTVRDYNRNVISVGGNAVNPWTYGLSDMTIQFSVQVLADVKGPWFVSPSPESLHRFVLYLRSTLTIEMCAKTATPSQVTDVVVISRQQESVTTSALYTDKAGRTGVRCAEVIWTPTVRDIGDHIFCGSAEDSNGIDTSSDRCFSVEVKDANFTANPTAISTTRPYFLRVPGKDEVSCEVMTTCIFPVYVKPLPGTVIQGINITRAFFDEFRHGNITSAFSQCANCYKTDVYIKAFSTSTRTICLQATDSSGVQSDDICVQPIFISKDPCTSMPCANGGACYRSPADDSDFFCQCLSDHYFGKDCSRQVDDCASNPCVHGKCINLRGPRYYCRCESGWDGKNCEMHSDNCTPDPCQGHGKCKNEVTSYSCECYSRYNGSDCSIDLCPSVPPTETSCHHDIALKINTTDCTAFSLESALSVDCDTSGWIIDVDMYKLSRLYPDARPSDVLLGDNSCRGTETGWYLHFRQSLASCFTGRIASGDYIRYRNEIMYAMHDMQHPSTIRGYNWTVDIECDISRSEHATGHLQNEVTPNPVHHVTVASHYRVNMTFYRDPGFNNRIPGNPLHVAVGADVYVKVFTTAVDWSVKMRLQSCYTKPSPGSPSNESYYLLKDGCEKDVNTHLISQSTHETTFVFRHFQYSTNQGGLYIYCDATFCEASDYSRQCLQACNPTSGRKRAAPEPLATTTVLRHLVHIW